MDERLKEHYDGCRRAMAQCRTIAECNEVAARYRLFRSTVPEGETWADAAARLEKRTGRVVLGPIYGPQFEKQGARETLPPGYGGPDGLAPGQFGPVTADMLRRSRQWWVKPRSK